jgi:hypothetical protein
LFNSEQARWVGVQVQGQAEQPRVLLVSAPYALKAGDAETIGGLPPSAFMLAAPPASGSGTASGSPAIAAGSRDQPATATDVTTTGGTANYLPIFNGASTIVDSAVFQSAASPFKIGIDTATPATTLDVNGAGTIRGALSLPATGAATATAGADSQPLNLVASAFNTTAAVNQIFQLQAEPAGNDTAAPSGTLNLLFGAGTAAPAETGLSIANNGQITFATGQTFPGAGTITGIATAGSGLTGGGTSGTPSLGLLTTCAANQVLAWSGSGWACATVGGVGGSGTVTSVATGPGLLGGPITTAGTLTIDTTVVPTLGAATNTFTGNIAAGNVSVTTGFQLQGYPFDYGSPFVGNGAGNSLLGFAGNQTMTGGQNVGVGWAALFDNTTGEENTAIGLEALYSNTFGAQNTAVGESALFSNSLGSTALSSGNTAVGYGAAAGNTGGYYNSALGYYALVGNAVGNYNTANGFYALDANITGSYNTAIGYFAGPTANNLSNTTAIGSGAAVGESNALVLGGTGANAVNVGIGTATPQYTLDVHGTGNFTGNVTFAPTQTFPGEGTISAVVAGTGLTGGGTSGSVTLNVNTALIPQLGAANTFTGNQYVTGNLVVSASGTGVLGESSASSGQAEGVAGLAASPSGYGVEGLNTSTGGGAGVYGSSASSTGYGVEGVVTASSGGIGVYGTAPAYGVQGKATGAGSTVGVRGLAASSTGYGVEGLNTSTGGGAGVYGSSASSTGYGVKGVVTASSGGVGVYGAAPYNGIQGIATATDGYGLVSGVIGQTAGEGESYHAAGVLGFGTSLSSTGTAYSVLSGVWGDASDNELLNGVAGTADKAVAISALNNADDSDYPALLAQNLSAAPGALAFEAGGIGTQPGVGGTCVIDVAGDLSCAGTISPSVETAEGRQVKLYGVASPENWFEDFGSGQLSGGAAQIPLDLAFASTVNAGEAYHVFLTPNGDSKGLYVASKTAAGFEVREQGGGTSNISFDYRIVAKRRGYESVRLEDVTDQTAKMRQRQAEMRAKRADRKVAPPAGPAMPEIAAQAAPPTNPARALTLKTTASPQE